MGGKTKPPRGALTKAGFAQIRPPFGPAGDLRVMDHLSDEDVPLIFPQTLGLTRLGACLATLL